MRPAKPFAVLAVATALASACGSPGGGPLNAGPRHVNLSFVYANAAVNATQEMAMGARAAARETPGVTFTEVAPPPGTADESVEVGLFRGAARTATDGVALQTSTPDAFGEPLRDAHASGLPLVAVDTPPPPSTGVDT